MDWRERLREMLPVMGHRNWIIVGDAAMPSMVGVETLATGEPLTTVLDEVLRQIAECGHVKALCRLDAELDHLDDFATPGVGEFRAEIVRRLAGLQAVAVDHADLLEEVSEAAKTYAVAMFKTESRIPYTSVFIELGCGYWSEQQEAAFREDLD